MPNTAGINHVNRCELFGLFGFFVQLFLGLMSFATLIGKTLKINQSFTMSVK